VRYEGARQWRHDPVHRHGVAYYNNNLRETYGSRHDSYQSDRNYREQHRDVNRNDNRNNREGSPQLRDFATGNDANRRQDNRRPESNNNDANNSRRFDRSEQVRERLNRDNNGNINGNNGNQWQADRNSNQGNITTSGIRTPVQGQEVRNDNSPALNRNDDNDRNRANIQQRHIAVTNNSNNEARVNQERRVITENADRRPSFVNPSPRTEQRIEQRTEQREQRTEQREQRTEQRIETPQPRAERQERRTDFTPPQRTENRGAEQRAERSFTNPRPSRERSDDNDRTK
jgi:hypothetical protein